MVCYLLLQVPFLQMEVLWNRCLFNPWPSLSSIISLPPLEISLLSSASSSLCSTGKESKCASTGLGEMEERLREGGREGVREREREREREGTFFPIVQGSEAHYSKPQLLQHCWGYPPLLLCLHATAAQRVCSVCWIPLQCKATCIYYELYSQNLVYSFRSCLRVGAMFSALLQSWWKCGECIISSTILTQERR